MRKYFPIILSLLLLLVVTVWSKTSRADDEADLVNKKVLADFYSETYSTPFNFAPVNFQRLNLEFKNLVIKVPVVHFKLTPFVGFENYEDIDSTNLTLATGFKATLAKNLRFEIALRRDDLSQGPIYRWEGRTGLVYGNFWDLPWNNFFADCYAELYYSTLQQMQAYWTEASWAQVGYRYIGNETWTFDPVTVGVRDSENSDTTNVGPEYKMLQIGPQVSYHLSHPSLSIVAKATRAWTISSSATVVNQYWFLLALGAQF